VAGPIPNLNSQFSEPPEVLVIGAGVAGLTAAVHLAERGLPVRVLEADSLYAGGRLWGGIPSGLHDPQYGQTTIQWRGHTQTFQPEHGIHGLWWNYQNLRATLERFGVAPSITPAREQAWIHAEGERVQWSEVGRLIGHATLPSPLNYLELFGSHRFLAMLGLRDWLALPWVWRSLLLCIALDPFERLIPLEGQALEEFFQGWSPRLRAMFIGLARSGLASTPEHISLAAFIAAMRFYSVLRRDSLRFVYFTGDPGEELINPLVERIQERGGEVLLGHEALSLIPSPSLAGRRESADSPSPAGRRGWGVRVETRNGPRTFFAQHVLLATDAPAARRLFGASPGLAERAAAFTWPAGLPNATVRVWFDRLPRDGPEGGIFTGDFSVDNFFWLERFQRDYAEWSRCTGGSAVEMHLYRTAEFFHQPDAVILALALHDLYRAWPELRGHVIHSALQRNAAAHTRLTIDKADRWLGVETPWPNLWACGDWVRGPWPALFIERAAVSGIEAANRVLQAEGCAPYPLAVYDPPEWLAAHIQGWLLGGRAWLRRLAGK
jgi:isorenieratene synthase